MLMPPSSLPRTGKPRQYRVSFRPYVRPLRTNNRHATAMHIHTQKDSGIVPFRALLRLSEIWTLGCVSSQPRRRFTQPWSHMSYHPCISLRQWASVSDSEVENDVASVGLDYDHMDDDTKKQLNEWHPILITFVRTPNSEFRAESKILFEVIHLARLCHACHACQCPSGIYAYASWRSVSPPNRHDVVIRG